MKHVMHVELPGGAGWQWLQEFDHEAYDGRGFGTFTMDKSQAKRFDNVETMFEFWRKVPDCFKVRPDGRPNRPLTALNVEFSTVED